MKSMRAVLLGAGALATGVALGSTTGITTCSGITNAAFGDYPEANGAEADQTTSLPDCIPGTVTTGVPFTGQTLTVSPANSGDKSSDGVVNTRIGCLFTPTTSGTATTALPLIVFFHGTGAADATQGLYEGFTKPSNTKINLLSVMNSYALNSTSAVPGFFVLAPQSRYVQSSAPPGGLTADTWDIWYRQLSPSGSQNVGGYSYPENVDAAAVDSLIAQAESLASSQSSTTHVKIDTTRIYAVGWSGGASFAYLYALNRPSIAAVAVYAAPNPFGAMGDICEKTPVTSTTPNNVQVRVFNPTVPVYQVHKKCDMSGICPNTLDFEYSQLSAFGNASNTDYLIDTTAAQGYLEGPQITAPTNGGTTYAQCSQSCGPDLDGDASNVLGYFDHTAWPTKWTYPQTGSGVPAGATLLEFLSPFHK